MERLINHEEKDFLYRQEEAAHGRYPDRTVAVRLFCSEFATALISSTSLLAHRATLADGLSTCICTPLGPRGLASEIWAGTSQIRLL
jgi:hypothetical protein